MSTGPRKFKPITGPKYTEREQDFLDMAAIHCMASYANTLGDPPADVRATWAWYDAEALLAERKKRL